MKRLKIMLSSLLLLSCSVANSQAEDSPQGELKRLQYCNPGLVVDLGVGLWAWPMPMDFDGDGDLDLIVSCPDVPYNGVYFFENPGGDAKMPVFKPGVRIGPGLRNVRISYVNGKPRVLTPGAEWFDFLGKTFKISRKIRAAGVHRGKIRANQWHYVDYDGDGALDLMVGVGDWSEYGWENAFNQKGEWTRGPLHGYVYFIRNAGTTEKPKYAKPVQLHAGGKPVDVFGMPSPNFADFDGDGDLDLLCGEFLDGLMYFQNVGTRTRPRYAAPRRLMHAGRPLTMDLQMITPTAVDWDKDGDVDLIVGDEDGRVAFIEHTGRIGDDQTPQFLPPKYFQQQARDLKFGALVTPVSVDWDGDGDEDLICGNTAGYVGFIENLADNLDNKLVSGNTPKWARPKLLAADGRTIRIQAGPKGSIQGPCEAKWGYTTLSVADWDHDGLLDLVVNSIWGKVVWYRNVGKKTAPKLAAAQPVEVQWNSKSPKPAWNWWQPRDREFVTQWRTTPFVIDLDRDGLNDLAMLDHEGYLAFFRRVKRNGRLQLLPGQRMFTDKNGKPLRLNDRLAGRSGRRKICFADWDGDGRIDLLVNGKNVNFFRNVSTKEHPWAFEDVGPVSDRRLAGHTTSPTTVDWNHDGRPDLLIGAEDGRFYYMPNPGIPKANEKEAGDSGQAKKQRKTKGSGQRGDRPNVLFIAVDDLRVELGCYGGTIVKSPNIDRLAKRGTLFLRAYCQQAVCNPSRASLLTGLRPDTIGVTDLPTHFRQKNPDLVTLPQLFKNHGYFTQNIGKIFHNWRQKIHGDPQSWSTPAAMHYNTHGADKPQVQGNPPPDLSGVPRTEMRDVPDDAYFDGRIANMAVQALRKLKDRRFFLAVGFWKPHSPFNAPKRYWDLYRRSDIQPPVNPRPPQGVPEIAMHDSREILRGFKGRKGGKPTDAEVLALRHAYYAATSYVDAQVGKVLDELDRLGIREKTIVVLWSDHGFHLGEHSLWAKTSNFELDARVPLIVDAPKYKISKGGRRTNALVELLDLYPTLADLCGLPAPKNLQGVSLRPLLEDPAASVKAAAFTQHTRPAYPSNKTPLKAMGYSMRTAHFRYTEWRDIKDGRVRARELYDHRSDPRETVNVARNARYAATVKKLGEQLGEHLAASRKRMIKQ